MGTTDHDRSLLDLGLGDLFGPSLTDTSCVYIGKTEKVAAAVQICAQYLESVADSVLVMSGDNPVGLVGGFELLYNLKENPKREWQYMTTVEEIMYDKVPRPSARTRLRTILDEWKATRRAFACVQNQSGYSPLSARKFLELGMRLDGSIFLSSIPKTTHAAVFSHKSNLGDILDLMFKYNTRKLLLEGSSHFISDRLILNRLLRALNFQENVEFFTDLSVKELPLGYARVIEDDIELNRLCVLMDKMDHPYVVFRNEDTVISPWDICLAFESNDLRESQLVERENWGKKVCPNCGAVVA